VVGRCQLVGGFGYRGTWVTGAVGVVEGVGVADAVADREAV